MWGHQCPPQAFTMLCLLSFIVAMSVIHWIALLFWPQSLCCRPLLRCLKWCAGIQVYCQHSRLRYLCWPFKAHLLCWPSNPRSLCWPLRQRNLKLALQASNTVPVLKVTMVGLEFKTSISMLPLEASITMPEAFLAVLLSRPTSLGWPTSL